MCFVRTTTHAVIVDSDLAGAPGLKVHVLIVSFDEGTQVPLTIMMGAQGGCSLSFPHSSLPNRSQPFFFFSHPSHHHPPFRLAGNLCANSAPKCLGDRLYGSFPFHRAPDFTGSQGPEFRIQNLVKRLPGPLDGWFFASKCFWWRGSSRRGKFRNSIQGRRFACDGLSFRALAAARVGEKTDTPNMKRSDESHKSKGGSETRNKGEVLNFFSNFCSSLLGIEM